MFDCIICLRTLDDSLKTEEHVFPESIGGTISIWEVCKDCNDHLGSFVDNHLVNNWFIQSQRLFLKLRGKSGKIPNPLENGTLSKDPSQKIKYLMKDGIPESLQLLPNIKRGVNAEGKETINIILDKSQEDKLPEILEKIKKRELKKGREINFKVESKYEGHLDKPPILTNFKFDLLNWQRGIIKIVYELTYRHLLSDFIDSEIAIRIRELLKLKTISESDLINANLIGSIELIDVNSGEVSLFDDPNSLYGVLYNFDGILMCEVRIFEIFRCTLTMYNNYTGSISPCDGIVIHVDVKNKNTREITLLDYIQNIGT